MGYRYRNPPPGLAQNGHAQIVVVVEKGHALVGVEEEAGEEAGDSSSFAGGVGVDVCFAQIKGRGQTQGREAVEWVEEKERGRGKVEGEDKVDEESFC